MSRKRTNNEELGEALACNHNVAVADASDSPRTPTAHGRAEHADTGEEVNSAAGPSSPRGRFKRLRPSDRDREVLVTTFIQLSSSTESSEGSVGTDFCDCAWENNFPPVNAPEPPPPSESADNFAPDESTASTPVPTHPPV